MALILIMFGIPALGIFLYCWLIKYMRASFAVAIATLFITVFCLVLLILFDNFVTVLVSWPMLAVFLPICIMFLAISAMELLHKLYTKL